MSDMDVREAADQEFCHRIRQRDPTVLVDIDRAYSGGIRRLLRRSRGSALNETDIDGIVFHSLQELWQTFANSTPACVVERLFQIARRRCQDHLRKVYRDRERLASAMPGLAREEDTSARPEEVCAQKEHDELMRQLSPLLDNIIAAALTERERTALRRRYAAGPGEHWAKQLEVETGVPAKQWRKASNDATNKVRLRLLAAGVTYVAERGEYEIA